MIMMHEIEQRLRKLEEFMGDAAYDTRNAVRSELYQRQRLDFQQTGCPHLFSALCVNTLDPMAEGQVQFYTPAITLPGTPVDSLPWAYPISTFGGFDDSGVSWVPPAGSKLALFCENGDINQAYYVGTFWTTTRGVAAGNQSQGDEQSNSELPPTDDSRNDLWGYQVPEYDCIWEGTRDGYLLGSNRGDQVKMPWNTDNYQTKDWDTKDDFDPNPESNQFITYPHIHGFKTPGKHYWKGQDGDHRCNDRWSHLEMASGRGNRIMFKDDHLHPAAQWAFSGDLNSGDSGNTLDTENANPCYEPLDDFTDCKTPNEQTDCQDPNNPEQGANSQSDANSQSSSTISKQEFANAFFKRKEEMRFFKAVDALAQYQNPVCELKQSGIQMQSIGGIQLVMDDSVDQPQGKPDWRLDFDFGCNDVTKAKFFIRSQTGHGFYMDDEEDDTLIRSKNNGIRAFTAAGNRFEMLDHTLGDKESPQEAGEKRGIFMKSTSQHVLEFHDEGNQQYSLPRKHPEFDETTGELPDITEARANKAFILLRSGYGLQLRMDDSFSQENTEQQYIQLLAPQRDNTERGPHQMVFQEKPEGPGLVMLRAGGVYYRSSFDDAIEVVGDENNPEPANKFVQVTGSYIVDVDDYYFNHNDLTIFQAEKYVILFAGRDCPEPGNPAETAAAANQTALGNAQIAAASNAAGQPNQFPLNKGPCLYPVVVGKDPFVCPFTNYIHYGIMSDPSDPTHTKLLYNSLSDRVFASASQDQATQNQEAQGNE